MKKTLISLTALMMSLPVMAADNCAYSPLQNFIRNVRTVEEINKLANSGVIFDEKVRCGGSLLQLAILRGNPEVLQVILNQDRSRANAVVSLDGYQIQGAPREVPVILFAAYYAPSEAIFRELWAAGANVAATDSQGRNLLWYMDQNPVLRSTKLYDELNNALLNALSPRRQQYQPGQNTSQQGQGGYGQGQQQTPQIPMPTPTLVDAQS